VLLILQRIGSFLGNDYCLYKIVLDVDLCWFLVYV
jgi:hypothetical protein